MSRRILFGWLIVSMASLCQAPRLYGDGDPDCPTCGKGQPPAMGPSLGGPSLGGGPSLDLPPHGNIPVSGGHDHDLPPGVPVGAPVDLPGEIPHGDVPMAAPEIPIPIVKLKIKVPACAAIGKELEYRVKVENVTPVDAHNVVVRMSMPASVRILRASPQVHQRDPELQWNLGTIPGHGCHDIVVLVMPIGLADIKSCTRVTFEHGQCVTTKVMALAPEGSADGRVPPGTIPGYPGMGDPGFPGGPGGPGARADFDVRIFGPVEAAATAKTTYKIVVFNKSTAPLYKVGVSLEWPKDLDYVDSNEKLVGAGPGLAGWPDGLIDMLPPNASRTLELTMRSRGAGRFCIKASASANVTQNPADNKIVNAKDQACTDFRIGIPGMTLEMFDRDDPILKNGQTTYPIRVTNQGKDPITGLTVKARVPELLEMSDVRGPVRYKTNVDEKRGYWVEFEPFNLGVGETQTVEVGVKAKGQVGDARFHVEMTADQLDRGPNNVVRWIVEEESTTIVPDEETRARIRETSRQKREKLVPGTVTSIQ